MQGGKADKEICVSHFNKIGSLQFYLLEAKQKPIEKIPYELLESADAASLNKWLALYVAETRKQNVPTKDTLLSSYWPSPILP